MFNPIFKRNVQGWKHPGRCAYVQPELLTFTKPKCVIHNKNNGHKCASWNSPDFSSQAIFYIWLILAEYYKQIYRSVTSIFVYDDGHKISHIWKYSETKIHNKSLRVDEACHWTVTLCTQWVSELYLWTVALSFLYGNLTKSWSHHRSPIVTRGYHYGGTIGVR